MVKNVKKTILDLIRSLNRFGVFLSYYLGGAVVRKRGAGGAQSANVLCKQPVRAYTEQVSNLDEVLTLFNADGLQRSQELSWTTTYGNAALYEKIKPYIPREIFDDMRAYFGGLDPCCVNLYITETSATESQLSESSYLWHTDGYPAFCKHLKLFVYLTEVGQDDGPFSYHSYEFSQDLMHAKGFDPHFPGRIASNKEFHAVLNSGFNTMCGKIGTSFVFSDSEIIHRAGQVKNTARKALVFEFLPGNGKSYHQNGNLSMVSASHAIRFWAA
jgi:hypothetical protein